MPRHDHQLLFQFNILQMKTRKIIRKQDADYSAEGWYFITICTKEMECFFGEIDKGVFHANEIGKQANTFWKEIPEHFPMVELGEFIIMPNHIHGIIGIVRPSVRTCHGMSPHKNQFSKPIPGSISTIIGQFKSTLTRWCRTNEFYHFAWQSRFYDHIIRNDASFDRITEYIKNNPANWNPHGQYGHDMS